MITKDKIYIVLIVITGAFCLYYLYISFKGNTILSRLSDLLINGLLDEFDKEIDSAQTIKYAKPFNIDYLKLNRALMEGNQLKIDESFERFSNVHMNTSQKSSVYQRAYYYYLSKQNYEKAKYYYLQLDSIIKYQGKEKVDITYDIYIEKGYKYLDKVIKYSGSAKGSAKIEYYALLADMYQNKGDAKNSEYYKKLVQDAIEKS